MLRSSGPMPESVDPMSLKDESTLDSLERLRRLQRVTDATLAHLSVDELLDELLERVREILDVDTAAVLLLDRSKNELVARAAKGLEEEVIRGVRIPVGRGFAGRIAASGRPIVLDRVDHTSVLNPILRQKGIRSLMGVPLLAHGEALGVMHVGSTTKRRFRPEELELLQLVGDRVALALEARLSERARTVLETFQRAFMPESLPDVPGLQLATRYLPAATVGMGGDWYDVFMLPSGELVLVMGDVAGHGMAAASVMGKARNALRAYALSGDPPGEIATKLDRFLRDFGDGELLTLLLGMFDQQLATFRFVSAGHVPPLMVTANGSTFVWSEPSSPPLGLARATRFDESVVRFEHGDSLLLYTDGLVERRGESLDVSLERLRSVAGSVVVNRPAEDAILELVARLVGDSPLTDDAAVLLVHRQLAPARTLQLPIAAQPTSLAQMRRSVRQWLEHKPASETTVADILTAVSEACANSIEHAYGPSGGFITVTATLQDDVVEVAVEDTGRWRPERQPAGKGIVLMEGLMDTVDIRRSDAGTAVVMQKRLG